MANDIKNLEENLKKHAELRENKNGTLSIKTIKTLGVGGAIILGVAATGYFAYSIWFGHHQQKPQIFHAGDNITLDGGQYLNTSENLSAQGIISPDGNISYFNWSGLQEIVKEKLPNAYLLPIARDGQQEITDKDVIANLTNLFNVSKDNTSSVNLTAYINDGSGIAVLNFKDPNGMVISTQILNLTQLQSPFGLDNATQEQLKEQKIGSLDDICKAVPDQAILSFQILKNYIQKNIDPTIDGNNTTELMGNFSAWLKNNTFKELLQDYVNWANNTLNNATLTYKLTQILNSNDTAKAKLENISGEIKSYVENVTENGTENEIFNQWKNYIQQNINSTIDGNNTTELMGNLAKYIRNLNTTTTIFSNQRAKEVLENYTAFVNQTLGLNVSEEQQSIKNITENTTLEEIMSIYQNVSNKVSSFVNDVKNNLLNVQEKNQQMLAAWQEYLRGVANETGANYTELNDSFGYPTNENYTAIDGLLDASRYYKDKTSDVLWSFKNDSANNSLLINRTIDSLKTLSSRYSFIPKVIEYDRNSTNISAYLNELNDTELYNFTIDAINNGDTLQAIKTADGKTFVNVREKAKTCFVADASAYDLINKYFGGEK